MTNEYQLLRLINEKVNYIMAAIDDLNNAVVALSDGFTALDASIQEEITALQNALNTNNDAAVQTAATNISTVSSNMKRDADALKASLPQQPVVSTASPVASSLPAANG